jgi:AAA+ superfamily predicted ATPase
METERMVRYSERNGFVSDRSHLLEIYRGIETEANRMQAQILERRKETELAGVHFPFQDFIDDNGLSPEEVQILLVLLYNESVGTNHTRFATGNEILNLVFVNPVDALKASRFLDGGGTLFAKGLVRSNSDDDNANFLRAAYEVTEKTLHEVLGVSDHYRIQHRYSRAACKSPNSSYRVVTPHVSLPQVVLPEPVRRGVEEILWQVEDGKRVFKEWGMTEVLEKGKGTIVLFSGPPGTGKTMTAEAIAARLGKKLHIADYAQLESKWIGETEKNIVSIFQDAAAADAVLLMDEADAILSARLDGSQYNDVAYNRQVSILLTEIEAYEGLCILTTNRSVTLDDGLARRVSATFNFGVPGPEERLRIWESLLPGGVPLAKDIDLEALARRFPMAGGNIKNAIVTAVRKAALRGGRKARVTQKDFGEAARGEKGSFRPGSRPIGFGEGGFSTLFT